MAARPFCCRFAWMIIVAQLIFGVSSLQAGTLLRTDFESAGWPALSAYTNNVQVTAAATYGGFGTILNYGSSTPSQGISFTVDSSAAAGSWNAGFTSGILSLTTVNTTVTNLGLMTLSFSLSASQTHPVLLKLESYTAGNVRSGGLQLLIYPATTNFYQRFAIDLSTMTPFGDGSFDPTSPQIAISFELDSAAGGDGWPNAAGLGLQIDNVNYATPAFYVATNGSNSNAGTNEATAFATPSYALSKATPGSIIVVKNGTYLGHLSFGTSSAGAPDAWVVLKNYPGQSPILRNSAWSMFSFSLGAAYDELRGMDLLGYSGVDTNGDRYLAAAYTNEIGLVQGDSNGNGIDSDGAGSGAQECHDLRIANNVVEYNSAGSIGIGGDRIQIENNICRNNAWWCIYGESGISVGNCTDFENNHNFRILIQGNQCYGNETMVPWINANPAKFSDGNGIILDTNPGYQGRMLVQNNLCYNNGGSGIHTVNSPNAYIIHNTAYYNSANPKLQYDEIFAYGLSNVWMLNNIMVAPPNITGNTNFNEPITSNSGTVAGTVFFQTNLYWGGQVPIPTGAGFNGNVQADPQFISPSIDPASASFRLAVSSPGRNNAVPLIYRSDLDAASAPRPSGIADQGSYQVQSTDCFPPMFSPLPGNFCGATTVTLTSGTAGATIVYTTDGTIPVINSDGVISNGIAYTGTGIAMSSATTLNAIAWKSGLNPSAVTGGNYTFNNLSGVPVPNLLLTYFNVKTNGITVGLVCRTPGALVRYTLDGSLPSATYGTLASATLPELDANQTLQAIAYTAGRANSAVSPVAGYSVYANASPGSTTATNTSAIEVGTRFRSQVNGQVISLRVWHPPGGSTNFSARLWTGTGTSLATVTVNANTANAWAVALVSPPINIQSNTDYIVSYSVPANYAYKAVAGGLTGSVTNGALYLPAGNNGIYATSSGTFPAQNGNGTNYGADVFILVTPALTTFSQTASTVTNYSFEANGRQVPNSGNLAGSANLTGWSGICYGYVNSPAITGLNGTNAIFICGNIYQNTGATFVAGATYTLTIQVGRPTGAPAPGANGMSFGFATAAGTAWVPGTSPPFFNFSSTPSGSMTTYTYSYTALASDAGNPVVIRLNDYSDSTNPTRSAANGDYALDNVTLTVSQIVPYRPPSVPGFASVNVTNNQFGFMVTGTPGASYVIQATTNLNPAQWVSLMTKTAPFTFTDTNSLSQRFYRAQIAQ